MAEKKAETWHFSFRALPDRRPAAIRYRQLLKYALRAQGLKCVGYGPAEPKESRGAGRSPLGVQ